MKPITFRASLLWVLIAAPAILLLPGCGKTPSVTSGADQPPGNVHDKALARYDENRDGILSGGERKHMEADFVAEFDSDGDGTLNNIERATARRNSRSTVVSTSPAPTTREAAEDFLERFDADGDGKLSQAEAGEQRWKVMARADRDGDGYVTADEWFARNNRPRAARASE